MNAEAGAGREAVTVDAPGTLPQFVYLHGHTHRHGTAEPGWVEHAHLGGGAPHAHDPETGRQVSAGALPPEAVAAVIEAADEWGHRLTPADAERILEAAAPHLAAVEHARLQPELNRIEHDAIARIEELAAAQEKAVAEAVAADRERLRGAYVCRRHGWEHCEDITCQMLADAVAAEREHCAQLAEQHAATGSKCAKGIAPNPSSDCWCRAARPRFAFAALLRRGGEGGG